MDADELSACYEEIGSLRCFVRKPRLMDAGNEIRLWVGNENPDVDLALALGAKKFLDCEVMVVMYLLKDADGKDLRKPRPSKSGKPYAHLAQLLYQGGFFNAERIQKEIGQPEEGTGQSMWASALAKQLNVESMGHCAPEVLVAWATVHEVEWMLPREYGVKEEDDGG